MVSSTPGPHFTSVKDPVPIVHEAGSSPGPVWTGGKSRPHRDSIPDRPARSQSLYRLSYPAHTHSEYVILFFHGKNGYVNAPYCYLVCTLYCLCPSFLKLVSTKRRRTDQLVMRFIISLRHQAKHAVRKEGMCNE